MSQKLLIKILCLIPFLMPNHGKSQSINDQINIIRKSQESPDSIISELQRLNEFCLNNDMPDSTAMINYQLGYYSYILGDWSNSESYIKEAISIFKKIKYNGYRVNGSYLTLLRSLRQTGQFRKAIKYQNEIKLLSKTSPYHKELYYACAGELGKIYNFYGEYEIAKTSLAAAVNENEFESISQLTKNFVLFELAEALYPLGNKEDIKSAHQILDQLEDQIYKNNEDNLSIEELSAIYTIRENIEYLEGNLHEVVRLAEEFGTIVQRNKKTSIDNIYYLESMINSFVARYELKDFINAHNIIINLEHFIDNDKSLPITRIIEIYQNIALSYSSLGDYEKSKSYFTKAFHTIRIDPNELGTLKNFENENKILVTNLIYDYIDFLNRSNKKRSNENYLDISNKMELLDSLVVSYLDHLLLEESVLNIKDRFSKYYALGTDIAFQKNDTERFFRYAERNKGLTLFEKWQDQAITDSVEFHILRDSLKATYRGIMQLEYGNESSVNTLNNAKIIDLNSTKNDLLKALRNLRTFNPTYNIMSLDEVNIPDNESFLYYHFGQDTLYGMVLNNLGIKMEALGASMYIDSLVNSYIADPKYSLSDEQASISLFNILIGSFNIEESNINIIPDGSLNFLPFSSLIDTSKESYLGETHNIRYSISLTLDQHWSNMKPKATSNFSVISPDYEPDSIGSYLAHASRGRNSSDFIPLQFAKNEMRQLSNKYRSVIIEGDPIDKETLLDHLENSQIFHFSGHAVVDLDDYRFSFLALGDNGTKFDNVITMAEISEAKTSADLVFLNACNTGSGKFLKGEGVFDLSRSFFAAGAKTTVNSLWEIDDQSSMIITLDFYKYLKKGFRKSEALRKAQMDYINDPSIHEFKKTPYYWAGLVLVGNNDPLQFEYWHERYTKHLGLVLIILILVIGGYSYIPKKIAA